MPIIRCKIKGKTGRKWGSSGKCYTGKDSKKKASSQAAAAYAGGYTKEEIDKELELHLLEAERDAKILRKINIDLMKKEIPRDPDEEIRDYFLRLQDLEQQTSRTIGAFPTTLVDWVHGLTDDHFPRDGRKMFAKWLGNTIWYEEVEGDNRSRVFNTQFVNLEGYNNDIRYIVDYLNGAEDLPKELWDLSFPQMFERAEEWHETLKGVEATGEYETKKVVYRFENGFTIVQVPPEDLEVEGEFMGHCVGTYCDPVSAGVKEIYSLRDVKNRPHATIEVKAGEKFTLGPDAPGTIQQIKGKGNATPAEKYRPMIKQWLKSTDLPYQDSRDYWDILSEEEIIGMVESGDSSIRMIGDLAKTTKNDRVIDYFVDGINSPEFLDKLWVVNDVGARIMIRALSDNRFLSEEQVLKVVETDLEIGALGGEVEAFFTETYSEFEERRPSGRRMGPLVWEKFRDKLKQNIDENKLGYMSSIVKYSDKESLSREIVNFVLNDQVVDALVKPKENVPYDTSLAAKGKTPALFRELLQNYLLHNKDADRDTLVRIFHFTRTLKGEILAGSYALDSYVANSRGIASSVVEGILSDKLDPPGLNTKKNLILNPSVEEKYKYSILKKMMSADNDTYSQQSGHPIVKQLGRLIWRDKHVVNPTTLEMENRQIFSEKFLLWCLDASVFDGVIQDKSRVWATGQKEPSYMDIKEHTRREIMDLFNEPKEEDFIDEQVDKYFKKNIFSNIKNYAGQKGNLKEQISFYLNRIIDKEYLKFENHPQSTVEKLLNEEEGAPWD